MAKREKKVEFENPQNLYNLNKPLYELIVAYGISHLFIAEHLYPAEWNEDNAKKLAGRFRNKLDGKGAVTDAELTDLINIITEMADSMQRGASNARRARSEKRKAKIQAILEALDDESFEKLDLEKLERNL
ncbi:hypothetical protein [Pontibacter sp. BAB1700]|uniref:hypothetical protein n=1 Tax=Pontibacter sp. BAB1700 TaxID=1144253 RepID=UPI0002E52329|nr:hypothetical protein [Pontibacter sp. BAB1700]